MNLAAVEINVGHVAVRAVEHILFLLDSVSILANDRVGGLELAVALFLLLPKRRRQAGKLGRLLVIVGLKLIDLGQERLPFGIVLVVLGLEIGLVV